MWFIEPSLPLQFSFAHYVINCRLWNVFPFFFPLFMELPVNLFELGLFYIETFVIDTSVQSIPLKQNSNQNRRNLPTFYFYRYWWLLDTLFCVKHFWCLPLANRKKRKEGVPMGSIKNDFILLFALYNIFNQKYTLMNKISIFSNNVPKESLALQSKDHQKSII